MPFESSQTTENIHSEVPTPEPDIEKFRKRVGDWLEFWPDEAPEKFNRAKIQQELGAKVLPVIRELVDRPDARLHTSRLLRMTDGIDAPEDELYPIYKQIAGLPSTLRDPNLQNFTDAIYGMLATAPESGSDTVDDLNKLSQKIPGGQAERRKLVLSDAADWHARGEVGFQKRKLAQAREESRHIASLTDPFELIEEMRRERSQQITPEQMMRQSNLAKPFEIEKAYLERNQRGLTYESNGLKVNLLHAEEAEQYIVDGQTIDIPEGTLIGEIHFTPYGINNFEGSAMTKALVLGYYGVKGFIDRTQSHLRFLTEPKIDKPRYIIGKTNPHMANMAVRFGFQVVDEDRPLIESAKSGQEVDPDKKIRIVATVDSIARGLKQFDRTTSIKKLRERAKSHA